MHGTAVYVGALVGPGVLLVPALAVRAAGAAALLALGGLLGLSALVAATFAALGARLPVAGGVSAYARTSLGDTVAAITGGCFLLAVFLGVSAVSLICGFYVAELTSSGRVVADFVGLAVLGVVVAVNALGLRVSSRVQLVLSSLLVVVVAAAAAVGVSDRPGRHWRPLAPHGWGAVVPAAELLVWLFFGWEAIAQLADKFACPQRDLPRAARAAWMITSALYAGLMVATVVATTSAHSRVPLADLMSVGFGPTGREATAALAVVLTIGTLNVYMSGTANLISSLAQEGVLPRWFARDADRSVPRRPLILLAGAGCVVMTALIAGVSVDAVVRATSACYVAVYGLVLFSAIRLLRGRVRLVAAAAFILIAVLALLSASFLLVPLLAAAGTLAVRVFVERQRTEPGS